MKGWILTENGKILYSMSNIDEYKDVFEEYCKQQFKEDGEEK